MKIAVGCGRDIETTRDTDGGSVLIRNLVRELGRRGAGIDLFVPADFVGGSRRETSKNAPVEFDVSIIRFSVKDANLPLRSSPSDPGSYFLNRIDIGMRIAEYFKNGLLDRYDRVYIFHVANAFGLARAHLLPRKRTILFPMMPGAFYEKFEDVPEEYIAAERATFAAMDHIAVASEAERLLIGQYYGVPASRILLMRRGYDATAFTPLLRNGIPAARIRILCANVVKPQKDQMFFIEFVKEARKLFPALVIHLAGMHKAGSSARYNQYAADLELRIDAGGLRSHFIFHDILSQANLNALMRECDIAFYPSRTETFGKSALESVVTGLPTIVFSDVPAFTAFITDRETGLAIKRDVQSAVNALQELWNDQALYAGISARGIASAPQHTWECVVDNFLIEEARHVAA